jgi:hypothetical protein
MRNFQNAIKGLPHAEERAQGASRSTHNLTAALRRTGEQVARVTKAMLAMKKFDIAALEKAYKR